jgi:hypothetical protein
MYYVMKRNRCRYSKTMGKCEGVILFPIFFKQIWLNREKLTTIRPRGGEEEDWPGVGQKKNDSKERKDKCYV